MRIDDRLQVAFQEELNALEHFRLSYASMHPSVPLDRDDPDVKRLMETMAFFGARSRMAAENHILALRRRLFQQFFDYLLSPLPAMGLLQAKPTGQFADALTLPRGSQFLVTPPDGRRASFRLLSDLKIMPLSLVNFTTLFRPDQGLRLLLRLRAPYARNDDIGLLRIHINHLNDFKDSLRVLHAIEEHLDRASVVYDGEVNELTDGSPCSVTFGMPERSMDEPDGDDVSHPLERERLLIHFPQQELFLNVQMAPSPTGWSTATLCLDLDERWPRSLVLNRDIFQLYVVPAANLKGDFAQPITCEGIRECHAVSHPQPELGFALHSVRGVYEIRKEGLVPLRPGIFSGGNGSYEIDQSTESRGRKAHWLALNFPEAFETKKRIAVDALWHQPWFTGAMTKGLKIIPFSRQTTGVVWEWCGPLAPYRENAFIEEYDGVSRLVILMNKTTFNVDDIKALLSAAGVSMSSHYGEVLRLLSDVRCVKAPQKTGRGGAMVKLVYEFTFHEADLVHGSLLEAFTAHVQNILDAWVSDTVVEVRMKTAGTAPTI